MYTSGHGHRHQFHVHETSNPGGMEYRTKVSALARASRSEEASEILRDFARSNVDVEEAMFLAEAILASVARAWSPSMEIVASLSTQALRSMRARDVLSVFARDHGRDQDSAFRSHVAASVLHDRFVIRDGYLDLADDPTMDDVRCREAASRIASIPERCFGREDFEPRRFVSSSIMKAWDAVQRSQEETHGRRARILAGVLFERFARRGHVRHLSDMFLNRASSKNIKIAKEIDVEGIVDLVDDARALELFGVDLFLAMSRKGKEGMEFETKLDAIIGRKFKEDFNLYTFLSDTLLTSKTLPIASLRFLLDFLHRHMHAEADGPYRGHFSRVVARIANAWSDRDRLASSSRKIQTYLTSALCMSLEKLQATELSEENGLMGDLLQGVGARLESPREWVREHGMVVANLFAYIVDSGKALIFDELASYSERGMALLMLLQDIDDTTQAKDEQCHGALHREDGTATNVVGPAQPDRTLFERESWLSSDSDDDSDFEDNPVSYPLSTSGTSQSGPQHIKALIAMLRCSNEPLKVGEALERAETLIRYQPDELPGMTRELIATILHAKGPTWEDEEGRGVRSTFKFRYGALVAILVQSPKEAALKLVEEIYSPHLDVSQRVMLLDVMSDAAKELSYSGKAALPTMQNNSREVAVRYPAKTRVFGQRSLQRMQQGGLEVHTNRFIDAVPEFMLPLMRDFDARKHGVDFLGSDFLVLGKLMTTLGTFVECSSISHVTAPLCQLLLDLMRSIANHQQPFVRKSVLTAGCSILVSLPAAILARSLSNGDSEDALYNGLRWLQRFAAFTSVEDKDEECCGAGRACLQLLAQLARKAEDEMQCEIPVPHITDLAAKIRLL